MTTTTRDEHDIIDERPGRYYVSVRNDAGQWRPLLGPFDSHLEAIEHVEHGKRLAQDAGDPRAAWYSYGTARLHDDAPPLTALFPTPEITR